MTALETVLVFFAAAGWALAALGWIAAWGTQDQLDEARRRIRPATRRTAILPPLHGGYRARPEGAAVSTLPLREDVRHTCPGCALPTTSPCPHPMGCCPTCCAAGECSDRTA